MREKKTSQTYAQRTPWEHTERVYVGPKVLGII